MNTQQNQNMTQEQIRNVLNSESHDGKKKAEMLGFRRTSLYVGGQRVSGFRNSEGKTFRSVKTLIRYYDNISKEHPHIQ